MPRPIKNTLVLLAIIFCAASITSANANNTREAVVKVLTDQAAAWNKGNLNDFLQGYKQSDDTSFASEGKVLWGFSALKERYQKRYGTKSDTMGHLEFSHLHVRELGSRAALCIGSWHVDAANANNAAPSAPPLEGTFSLVLERTSKGWKIIHDHTSRLPQVSIEQEKKQ